MALEHRQAALLELLRAREGAPVSFAELQQAGIEFPASVVSELELAGSPVERCVFRVRDAAVVGVRLDPQRESAAEAAAPSPASEPTDAARPRAPRRSRRGLQSAAWLAPVALFASAVVIAVIVPIGTPRGHAAAAHHRVSAVRAHRAGAPARAGGAPRTTALHGQNATPVSATLAIQLEAHGHELLEDGQYRDAVRALTNAVSATGEQPGDCLQPTSETCLTYAYALYDLGRALQLDGRAAAAVPVLQRRLQIDNQRATVAFALERARAQSG